MMAAIDGACRLRCRRCRRRARGKLKSCVAGLLVCVLVNAHLLALLGGPTSLGAALLHPLHASVYFAKEALLTRMLAVHIFGVDCRDTFGLTPLAVAAHWGHDWSAEILLAAGARPAHQARAVLAHGHTNPVACRAALRLLTT